MTDKIRNENYISVLGFMVNELNLKGTELLVYAVIYGFSQAEGQRYTGSLQYLADWTGATKRTVINTLKSMCEKGIISREEKVINGVTFVEYWANTSCAEISPGVKKLHGGGEKISPNIISILKKEDIISNEIISKKESPKFVPPTVEEVREYCESRNSIVDPESFVAFYASKNWMVGKNKMSNWHAAVITWEKNENQKRNTTGKKGNLEDLPF